MSQHAILHLGQPSPDDDRPGMLVHVPYLPALVDELKELPARDRRWVRHEEAWWVAAEHEDAVLEILWRHLGAVEVVDEDGVVEWRDPSGSRERQEDLFG